MASSKICPERGSEKCARIIYGLPVPTEKLLEQLRSTRVVLGGPVKDEYSPQWKCQDCGAEVYEERAVGTWLRPSAMRECRSFPFWAPELEQ
jgi:hypothetical protein